MRARGTETILVVEDDASVRDAVRIGLSKLGYTVLAAASAAEAITLVQGTVRRPDVLLLDLVLPGTSAKQLLELLVSEGGAPNVLLMTGHPDNSSGRTTPPKGYPIMRKPFGSRALALRIRELLDTA